MLEILDECLNRDPELTQDIRDTIEDLVKVNPEERIDLEEAMITLERMRPFTPFNLNVIVADNSLSRQLFDSSTTSITADSQSAKPRTTLVRDQKRTQGPII